MKIMKKNAWIASAILLSSSLPVYAASVSDMARQEQLQQAREADAARNERLRRPTVSMEGVTTNVNPSIVPGGPSFFIREIQLDGMTDEFSFLHQYLKGKDHHHLDVAAINSMVQQMNQALLDKGYATSKVIIPEQNLAGGVLHLTLQLGRIHAVTYSEGSSPIPWRTAFPIGEGDVVKVPLLEQGLEQMKSLSSQDVMMKLVRPMCLAKVM